LCCFFGFAAVSLIGQNNRVDFSDLLPTRDFPQLDTWSHWLFRLPSCCGEIKKLHWLQGLTGSIAGFIFFTFYFLQAFWPVLASVCQLKVQLSIKLCMQFSMSPRALIQKGRVIKTQIAPS